MELKTALKIARLTQLELAERAGVDPAVISRLVSGKQRRPGYETSVRIARALNLAPDELFPVADVPRRKTA
jgi:transcriptional regulator with XRE-family HTH domain